jgi:beta-glucosidase-like glycosyl hydrolase
MAKMPFWQVNAALLSATVSKCHPPKDSVLTVVFIGVQSQGVAICPKHLVCNDSETERRFYDSIVDEQTLREVYLRPFEIIVEEAKPASIMTSYNRIVSCVSAVPVAIN